MNEYEAIFEAPRIDTVPEGVRRPFWSVMIPTFNCARYLRKTLESVLLQDPGPEQMQIEVVDDFSTQDDPEAVVREIGKGRVDFHRNTKNTGCCTLNFNVCIQRSRGHLVHILHGDDFIGPGFYRSVTAALEARPTAGLAIVRSFVVDMDGRIDRLTSRLSDDDEVIHSIPEQRYRNDILTPGVVVRRSAYEGHGGFFPTLVHVADWEMWDRLTLSAGCVFVNEPLAYYRFFPESDTGRLARFAGNLRDYLRLAEVFAGRHPDFQRDKFEARVSDQAWRQYRHFQSLGDTVAAQENFLLWCELFRKTAPLHRRICFYAKLAVKKQWNKFLDAPFPGS